MLLAERALLLARDLSGEPLNSSQTRTDLRRWLAVALLVELAAMGRLRFSEGRVSATDQMPTQHSLLTDTLVLLHRRGGLRVADAVRLVSEQHPAIVRELCESMERRGLLLQTRRRHLLLFPVKRYAVQSTRTRNEALDALRRAASGAEAAGLKELALYLLCDGMGVLDALLSPEERASAHERLARLEDELTGNRAATDPNLQRARLILLLTNPFAPGAAA